MTSIRKRLLFWLLFGVAILLVVAGSCIFFTVRYVLMAQVEAELQQARKVVYNLFQQGKLSPGIFVKNSAAPGELQRFRDEERWREFDYEDGELLYQLRKGEADILLRSVSLGERTIDRPEVLPKPRRSVTVKMSDGTRLRARIDYAGPDRRPAAPENEAASANHQTEIIVARDISEISRTLSLLLGGLWAAGLVAAAATAGLVTMALRKGLSPLSELGEEASKIDANSLTTRFGNSKMPEELLPICERLNSLMARLEGSFERERRFSSDLAHELRTPIAEISAMAEASMLYPERTPPDQFEKILTSARAMQGTVENLLDLARWEQGMSELDTEDLNLAEVIEECWKPWSAAAEEKELKVSLYLAPGQSITTNPGLYRNIINNLLSNAVEYTPRQGQVKIESLADESGVSTGLSVSNSVEAMTPSEVSHLFERFWRRDRSRTGGGHSGLGLSLALACAEILSLELTANLDQGLLRFELSA